MSFFVNAMPTLFANKTSPVKRLLSIRKHLQSGECPGVVMI